MRRKGLFPALGFAFVSLLSLGCARGPDVQAPALALKRVVIYRNGVAYFERAGKVETDQVTFRVRNEKVGDFLATLAVMEQGGSSVRSASFPVDLDKDAEGDDEEEVDHRYEILLKPPISKKADKKKDKLEKVTLTLDGMEHDLLVGYVAETPVWRPSYRLVIDDGSAQAGGVAGAAGGAPAMGGGAAAKGATKSADLQVWGIVQNQSGENWKGVTLSLVAGAPLAFQATLDKPVVPPRPIVSDHGEVFGSIPTGETSLAEGAPPPPPAEPMWAGMPGGGDAAEDLMAEEKEYDEYTGGGGLRKAERSKDKKSAPMSASGVGRGGGGYGGYGPMPQAAPRGYEVQQKVTGVMPSAPRSVSALAAVAMEAGTTRYDIPFPVDIPDKSATMVLLLAKKVPGDASFLFAPDGGVPESSSHPFRVARFTNDTKGLLERGPIAVFANGSFLGQGMVDPLPPGATATVPFALERGLAVDRTSDSRSEGARVAKVEAGELEIERDYVTLTKYTIKNGSDDLAKMLVKHSRQWGTRLVGAPDGTEDNVGTGSALVPIDVKAHATEVLTVDERRGTRQRISWTSQLADEAVKAYIADARSDAQQVKQLQKAWEVRAKLVAAMDERSKLETERSLLERQSDQVRRDLKSIEKIKTDDAERLRKDLTDRLTKASARLNEVNPRLVAVGLTIRENEIRFRDLINTVKILAPPAPPAGK
ncbi:MAG: hypothetical protein R3B70_47870 [Polyangiaceae bacterium]